ncbi:hypothetical protein H072_6355 [Dactylellina haptotyla CBS 200.50]|uniref:Uncharacterized protein n=1 Tax=Dactylellina haptotyla (strain CBS 200.50) TaxID=1284197 RepID=S8AFQ4_DACHA|nr:hypothetical protein H072_6355 [Dactylellina haptotyla CBS 200.50]
MVILLDPNNLEGIHLVDVRGLEDDPLRRGSVISIDPEDPAVNVRPIVKDMGGPKTGPGVYVWLRNPRDITFPKVTEFIPGRITKVVDPNGYLGRLDDKQTAFYHYFRELIERRVTPFSEDITDKFLKNVESILAAQELEGAGLKKYKRVPKQKRSGWDTKKERKEVLQWLGETVDAYRATNPPFTNIDDEEYPEYVEYGDGILSDRGFLRKDLLEEFDRAYNADNSEITRPDIRRPLEVEDAFKFIDPNDNQISASNRRRRKAKSKYPDINRIIPTIFGNTDINIPNTKNIIQQEPEMKNLPVLLPEDPLPNIYIDNEQRPDSSELTSEIQEHLRTLPPSDPQPSSPAKILDTVPADNLAESSLLENWRPRWFGDEDEEYLQQFLISSTSTGRRRPPPRESAPRMADFVELPALESTAERVEDILRIENEEERPLSFEGYLDSRNTRNRDR